jgi:hypothetical protein
MVVSIIGVFKEVNKKEQLVANADASARDKRGGDGGDAKVERSLGQWL